MVCVGELWYRVFVQRVGSWSARVVGQLLLLGGLSCSSPPHTEPVTAAQPEPTALGEAPSPSLEVLNVMPEVWAFWKEAEHLEPSVRAALFRKHVVARHPSLFTNAVVGLDPTRPVVLDDRIEAFVATFPERAPTMRRLSRSIEEDLVRHQRSFMTLFPDFVWDGRTVFTVSLDAFDGALREVDGRMTLLFGLDKIAALHGEAADIAPLFHHELFHVYHLALLAPAEGEPPRLYQALWFEGLAVHVAKSMHPEAAPTVLTLKEEMFQVSETRRRELFGELAAHLDSSDAALYRDFFRGSGSRPDAPPRIGYFLGLRVAEHIAAQIAKATKHPPGSAANLRELARLRDPELRQAIAEALAALATTG